MTRTRRPVDASVGVGSGWLTVSLVGVTLALLAVVAVASGGIDVRGVRHGPGSPGSSAGGLSGATSEYLLLLAIAGVVGIVVLLAFVFSGASWSSRGGARVAGGGARVPRWLAAILLVAVVAFPIAVVSWFGGSPREREAVSVGVRPSAPGVPLPRPDATAVPWDGWSWTPVVVLVGIALGATVVAVGLRSRGGRPEAPANRARRAAAAALDRTIDDLRRDPDPRHAVISAYAWMEDELTESGWGRRPSRAPFEYLDEALRELAVPPAPARSLTELFEVARFSRHRVDPSMKDRAIASLVEIQGSLREEPSP